MIERETEIYDATVVDSIEPFTGIECKCQIRRDNFQSAHLRTEICGLGGKFWSSFFPRCAEAV